MNVTYRKLSELTKLQNNPRRIEKEDMERLKSSIRKFGVIPGRQNKIVCLNRELDVYEYIKDPEEE